jgi:hypothetical protein
MVMAMSARAGTTTANQWVSPRLLLPAMSSPVVVILGRYPVDG